ncbi:MAG TPA: type II toxin-antitoxin system prevent-host-death family antitoxin [Candidatus Tumulicola sp.]
MKKIVNLYDAKNSLSKLVADALSGEEVIIAKNGRPLVKLAPVEAVEPRRLGSARGTFDVPDDFDAPLPPEVLEAFHS